MNRELAKSEALRPLAELSPPGRAWTPGDCLSVVRRLALLVQAMHEAGRLHRAIGLDTVGLDEESQPRLSPGPQVRRFGGESSDPDSCPLDLADGPCVELPESMAESAAALRAGGYGLDPRQVDIYQLGALLCRLLSGHSVRSYMYTVKGKTAVPAEVRPIVQRALGHDGANRFASAAELASALAGLEAESLAAPPAAGPHETPPRGSRLGLAETPATGHPVAPPPSGARDSSLELPFFQLGHYRVLARVGRGGMGDVYRAYDPSLDRDVAIKVLPAEFARQADFVRRFHAEATAAARLSHPNIVPIHFIGEDQGHHFFAMQYVEGESLAQRLAVRKRLPAAEAVEIVSQCLAGLSAAHHQGMIHRDIKPANILLERATGRAMLVDFGLVRRLGESERLTATGMIMGTVDYIAPEQARGQDVDGRADLYALGVLCYQLLSGRLPFVADTPTAMIFQHAYESPVPLAETAPDVPAALLTIIQRLMEKDPRARYQAAQDVLDDLDALRSGRPLSPASVVRGRTCQAEPDEPDADDAFDFSDDIPLVHSQRPLDRLRDWAATMFRRYSPEVVQQLQTTTQQTDGAVAAYERRARRLGGLLREAQGVVADLAAQIQTHEQVLEDATARAEAVTDDDDRQSALAQAEEAREQLAGLKLHLEEQQGHCGTLEVEYRKAEGRLVTLRSQRDLLLARLKVAQAQGGGGGARTSARTPQQALATVLALGLAAVMGLYLLWWAAALPPMPVNVARPGAVPQDFAWADAVGAETLAEKMALGDRWWEFASRSPAGPLRENALVWARHWYGEVLPRASRLDRRRLKERMTLQSGSLVPGLVLECFDGQDFTRLVNRRIDCQPRHFWGSAEGPGWTSAPDQFSLRWTGMLVARQPGDYLLKIQSDNAARLWLDGSLVIDAWGVGQPAKTRAAQVRLDSQPRTLKIEFMDSGAAAAFDLRWVVPGAMAEQSVPADALYHERQPEDDLEEQLGSSIAPGTWADVLQHVEPSRDRIYGRWERLGPNLTIAAGASRARLRLPLVVRGSYELKIEFSRGSGSDLLAVPLPMGESQAVWQMGGSGGRIHGLERVDTSRGASDPHVQVDSPFPNGLRNTLLLEVIPEGKLVRFRATINGRQLMSWSGPVAAIDSESFDLIERGSPGLGVSRDAVTFHAVQFRLRQGEARWFSPGALLALPTVPSVKVFNSTDASEASEVIDDLLLHYPLCLEGVRRVELLKYHDGADFPQKPDPKNLPGSRAGKAVAGSGGPIMLAQIYEPWPAGRYLVVYRVQTLSELIGPNRCSLDVCQSGRTIASRQPDGAEFALGQWRNIPVELTLKDATTIEYRLWPDNHPMAVDRVYVFRLSQER
jgi:serine/threonine protein kinase